MRAEGQAKATLIKVRAEAEANQLRQKKPTPLLIQQEWVTKWNWGLPTTNAGGASLTLGIK